MNFNRVEEIMTEVVSGKADILDSFFELASIKREIGNADMIVCMRAVPPVVFSGFAKNYSWVLWDSMRGDISRDISKRINISTDDMESIRQAWQGYTTTATAHNHFMYSGKLNYLMD